MRADRAPFTCEQLLELNETHRKYISDFAAVLETFTGCTSPAEELITTLVAAQAQGVSITPASLKGDVETFVENFEDAIEIARRMVRRYPIEVLGKGCGYEPDQIKALKEGHSGDVQEEAFELKAARDGLRRYPSLLVSAKMPEPWRSALVEYYSDESAEDTFSQIEDED